MTGDPRGMIRQLQLVRVIAACAMTVASVFAHVELTHAQSIADLLHRAQAGDPKAQYDLAEAYFEGNGMAKDAKQGLVWLQKSAGRGYGGAEATLGFFYQKGFYQNGVIIAPDAQEAANWYRKAARQNNTKAQTHLSEMLSQGLISQTEADWAKAEPVKEVKKSGPAPFSLGEVETGLSGGITNKRMATLVSTYGVDFKLGASTRKRLADEGADDNLLATIAAAKRSGQ
jgi:TPR repeat protein